MHLTSAPIYSVATIRQAEQIAVQDFQLTNIELMQRAGLVVFEVFLRRFSAAKHIAIYAGNGHNGGDGYVLAHLAAKHGLTVVVYQVGDHGHLSEASAHAFELCQGQRNVTIEPAAIFIPETKPDVIVDAILGIGLDRELHKEVADLIDHIEAMQLPIMAIDMPTGVVSDTGEILGKALHATITVTFLGLKLGLLTGAGVSFAGDVIYSDLSLPPEFFKLLTPLAVQTSLQRYAAYFKQHPKDWHKGLSGHVLVIGGDAGFTGAAQMAALAALRVGAGMVTIATQKDQVPTMNGYAPELMCHGIETDSDLQPLLEKATAIVVGPGLGTSEWAEKIWQQVVTQEKWMVVDADGLNLLAKQPQVSSNWVLTPHPGEAGRLLSMTTKAVQQNRLQAITDINAKYNGVCVLKGAGSLIASQNQLPTICTQGNPGMATAGMGDILSGIIGGLIAQGLPLKEAAEVGVYIHATAGDMAAKSGERGMIATDLMPFIRKVINALVATAAEGNELP